MVVGPGGGPTVKEAGSSDLPSRVGTDDGWGEWPTSLVKTSEGVSLGAGGASSSTARYVGEVRVVLSVLIWVLLRGGR